MRQVLAASRFLILLAVFGCLLLAVTLLVYGAYSSVTIALDAARGGFANGSGKKLLLACVEIVDLFLLATVFLITGLGLYSLFIDDTLPLPAWLEIHTLDDLKAKLLGVVVTVLAVLFLGQAETWDRESDLLGFGGGIALVIVALTYFLKQSKT